MIVVHLGEYVSGGVATYLRTLITEQIADPKIDKIYILMSGYKSQKLTFDSPKVKVVLYDYRRTPFGIVKMLTLWHQIVAWHADVVHLHSTFAGLMRVRYLFARPSRSRHIKLIYCAHGWSFERTVSDWKRRCYALIERLLAFKSVRIINISQSEQNVAIEYGLDPRQMTMIDNAISYEPGPVTKTPHAGKNFLFVGRFDRPKGLDVLLEAAAIVGPEIHFKIVGAPVLDDQPQTNRYPANVKAYGWLDADEINELYHDVDGLVVPSRWEGFGLVALEAMAQHTAVIASRVGGLRDIVIDNQTGLFFASEDAAGLASLLETTPKATLEEMGKRGYDRLVAHYDPKEMERRVYALYAE